MAITRTDVVRSAICDGPVVKSSPKTFTPKIINVTKKTIGIRDT